MWSYVDDKKVDPVTDQVVLDHLAKKYKDAQSEKERLQVCVSAINQGAIAVHAPVTNVDRIFGTKCARYIPSRPEITAHGEIQFRPTPDESAKAQGKANWFIRFSYHNDGAIGSYYLSTSAAQEEGSEVYNDCADI